MANQLQDPSQPLPEYVKGYVANPRETFSCELKPWLDPSTNEGHKQVLAKACLAMRNGDGGVILIGVSNSGIMQPVPNGLDIVATFTQDSVQAVVSQYSAQAFDVDVFHVALAEPPDSQLVAIVVPGGLTSPVMCKRDSPLDTEPRLRKGVIYARTLEANGIVSSAPASQSDLEQISKSCFDNRVADIGQFLRDHLTRENIDVLKAAVADHGPEQLHGSQEELDDFADASAQALTNDLAEEADN